MIRLLTSAIASLRSAWNYAAESVLSVLPWRRPLVFHAVVVEDFPDKLDKDKIYLAGEADSWWGAAMRCPCGCGDNIQLNLLPQSRPAWRAQTYLDGTITLSPSVWRQKGCRSHFVVTRGELTWC
jgi:hypothetical protein